MIEILDQECPKFLRLAIHKKYRHVKKLIREIRASRRTESPEKRQPGLDINLLSSSSLEELHFLKQRYEKNDTWIIDTEFVSLVDLCPVPLSIAIRTITGKLILSTMVDYKMSRRTFLKLVRRHLQRQGTSRVKHAAKAFIKQYRSQQTSGMTLSQIRKSLEELGYHNGKCILSWSTSIDVRILRRIMTENDDLIVDFPPVMQAMNVAKLCHDMIPPETFDLYQSKSLADIHTLLFRDRILQYHNAMHDTMAMVDIITAMVKSEA